MSAMNLPRRLVTLAVALPLAAGVLLAAAPTAGADVSQPVDGAVFTSYRPVPIAADYSGSSGTERLFLTSPGGAEVEVYSEPSEVGGGTLDYTVDLGCWSRGCSGRQLAPNGTWTVRQDGSTSDSSTFVTSIHPEAPTAVRAAAVSPRDIQVSWRVGDEPDLTSYDVYEGPSRVGRLERSACTGSTCSTVISYAADGTGEHTFTVRAYRSTAPGSASTLESPMSAPASATLEAAASPTPEADGTSGGSTGGSGGSTGGSGGSTGGSGGASTGGGATGGTPAPAPVAGAPAADQAAVDQAVEQRRAFALGFSTFGPKLGIPKLPPLPQTPPAIAPELADGTYEPTLGFEDQVVRERVEVAQPPAQRVRGAVSSALDSERLLRSTAAALVLLLAGAHLRRWVGSASSDDH